MATWAGYPASYTKGRNRPIQYVVIHSTEGSEGTQSAEAGVAYDKRRTDGTSTHLFVDTDTALREVPDADRAHHGRFHGNEIGIGIELCGRAGQTDAQWHDASSLPMLKLAAKEVAAICRAHALPVRRLSVAQVRAAYYAPASARPKGICGHIDLTRAYPEDQGSHTDPGPSFPWTEFLAMVATELDGDDMSAAAEQQIANIYAAVFTGGPSCGTEVAPANGRPASNSVINKLDWLIEQAAKDGPLPPPADLIAVKAALLDPEVLAAIAGAVADVQAARLAE
jgi:N-acetyl-anhydromuramyl-L-alanine amidase AmpD